MFMSGDCANLPHAPSAQLAELQGEQIAEVLKKQWNNEPLPDKMPEIKVQGFLGSLGDKTRFCLYHGSNSYRTISLYSKIRCSVAL